MNFLEQNGKHIEEKKPQCQSLQHKVTRSRSPLPMGQSAGWNVVWYLFLEFLLPLEIQSDGDSAWTGNNLSYLKHQLVKYLHKILLFYKHYIVGTGGEACVPNQIDRELTSETAKAQEVLYLIWKGFSKRYKAMFISKWQLFGLTSLTHICGLEPSVRATANSKCPENRDTFQSCFFLWQKLKV